MLTVIALKLILCRRRRATDGTLPIASGTVLQIDATEMAAEFALGAAPLDPFEHLPFSK